MIGISGKIVSGLNGAPLPGASLYLLQPDGTCQLIASTDALGNYNALVPNSIQKIVAAKKNFLPSQYDIGTSTEGPLQLLPNNPDLMQGAKNSNGSVNGSGKMLSPWWLVGGTTALVLATAPKKLSGVSDYILPVGLLIGGYLVLKNLGLLGGSSDQNISASQVSQSVSSSLSQLSALGVNPSYPDASFTSWANSIYSIGIASPGDASASNQVEQLLMQPLNTADVYKLIGAFGVKSINTGSFLSLCALAKIDCGAMDLGAFVKAVMLPADLASVNSYYNLQNINYQF